MNRTLVALATSTAALIVSATGLAGAAEALARDSVVARTGRASALDAFQGRLVWSEWDSSQNAYRLVELVDNAVRRLPVAPRAMPFDVDLGPDHRGSPIAVYSRCRKEPIIFWELDGRRGCDLYAFSFSTNRERKLTPASSRADEYFPAVWRDRVAFTRTYRSRPRGVPRRLIYWRLLSGRGTAHRLRGARGPYIAPHDLDMRGNRVAAVWQSDFGSAEIRVSSIGGRPRLISVVPGSGAGAFEYSTFGTSLFKSYVYWMVDQSDETPYVTQLRRHAIPSKFDQRARVGLDESTDAFAQDGDVAYYARTVSGVACMRIPCLDQHEIHRVDGLKFERAGRLPLR